MRRGTTDLFIIPFCAGSKDDSANGVPWGQRSRGGIPRVACFSLAVQLACVSSSVFLSPAAAARS